MKLKHHAGKGLYRLITELKLRRRKKGKPRVGRGGEKMSVGLGGQAGALKEVLESDTRGCDNNKVVWGKDSQVWIEDKVLWREFEYLRVPHEGRIHIYILKFSRIETGVVLEQGAGSQNSIPMTTARGTISVQCAQFQWSDGPTQRLPSFLGSWHPRVSVIFVHILPPSLPVLYWQEHFIHYVLPILRGGSGCPTSDTKIDCLAGW